MEGEKRAEGAGEGSAPWAGVRTLPFTAGLEEGAVAAG